MKGFSTLLTIAAGLIAAPYLVALGEHFLNTTPAWFPYVIVLLVAGVLYAVGVDIARQVAGGMLAGVVLFGIAVMQIPDRITFLQISVRAPF